MEREREEDGNAAAGGGGAKSSAGICGIEKMLLALLLLPRLASIGSEARQGS